MNLNRIRSQGINRANGSSLPCSDPMVSIAISYRLEKQRISIQCELRCEISTNKKMKEKKNEKFDIKKIRCKNDGSSNRIEVRRIRSKR